MENSNKKREGSNEGENIEENKKERERIEKGMTEERMEKKESIRK